MTSVAWGLLALTVVIAVIDWVAVATERRTVEYVCKPATMVALIGVVLALDPARPGLRVWFVVALVCSLAGDVFLMLPPEDERRGEAGELPGSLIRSSDQTSRGLDPAEPETSPPTAPSEPRGSKDLFIPGLVSFLVGHVAYVIGLGYGHRSWPLTGVGLVVVGLGVALVLPRLLPGARAQAPELVPPVVVYVCVISLMVVAAWGSEVAWAVVGATLFYVSDATLAWNRFVEERPNGRIAVMVTYHLGQIGLALSLLALR